MTVKPARAHAHRSLRLPMLAAALALALHGGVTYARSVYVLGTANNLALVPESQPGLAATSAVAVSGLAPGDLLVAIDVRPQNAQLYGLGFNSGAGTLQLYHLVVDSAGARAAPVGATGSFVSAASTPVPITGSAFGMDFNPTVDRIRVVNDSGQNFRINPNTGAFIDGDLGGAAGSVVGVNMDGSINGGTTTVDDAAYTNNASNLFTTTLYTIDSVTNSLYIQNPPNAGTQTLPITVMSGAATLDFGSESGFDIPSGVNVATSNTPASGDALAAFSAGGISGLYRLNLATGAATSLGAFGLTARDIAIAPETEPAIALDSSGTLLVRFQVLRPGTTTTVGIAGIQAGETLVGIAGRPSTGQVFGLGVNATANTATLYLLDPQSGASTAIGTPGQIAFVDAGGNPIDFPSGAWGLDFNPQVDRVRVISNATGLNFRVNPNTGAPIDGDLGGAAGSTIGTNPDAFINGAVGVGISGAAYTNNVFGTTVTTLYTLDAAGNRLFIQNPANAGTQTSPLPVTRNGVAFDFDTIAGFDIPAGVDAPASGSAANGEGFAALGTGTTSLYRINLATAAVSRIGQIGAGAPLAGLIVWVPTDLIFKDGFE